MQKQFRVWTFVGTSIVFCTLSLVVVNVIDAVSAANQKGEDASRFAREEKRDALVRIRELEKANLEQDVARAWARRDRRFFGIYDRVYSPSLPGVPPEKRDVILKRKNVQFLKSSGDFNDRTPEGKKLNRLLVSYATRYNKLLLSRFK